MNSSKTVERSLARAISEATDCIGKLYPLTNFIALNALSGFEEIPFSSAMRKATELFKAKGFLALSDYRAMYESGRIEPQNLDEAFRKVQLSPAPPDERQSNLRSVAEMLDEASGSDIVDEINKQMVKWCAAYLDRTQSQWSPCSKTSLYQFWRELAPHDLSMNWRGVRDWAQSVRSLHALAEEALSAYLSELELDGEDLALYLRRQVVQMPGYASYLKWLESENIEKGILQDYLAIRLHYEKMLSLSICRRQYKSESLGTVRTLLEAELLPKESAIEVNDYSSVWQEAYELNYRDKLLSSLNTSAKDIETASCQMVFCIDVRSEPIRREIEKSGPYETYGFAGFFGIPMRFKTLGSAMSLDLCPVLLKPSKSVKEKSCTSPIRMTGWQALKVTAWQLKKKLKSNLAGAFGLVELFGLFSALPLAMKTFFPSKTQKFLNTLEKIGGGSVVTKLDLSEFSLDEKIQLAEGVINGIGMTKFANLVIFCGHKSSSQNNPFASSLDCGACGANGGGSSARLAAEFLNDQAVRSGLSAKGLSIPEETIFIAAEHDTTTDLFKFLCDKEFTAENASILERLKADLLIAGERARKQRAKLLPQCSISRFDEPLERSCDWAQTAPEWGLAGNAAFIAAPRAFSQDCNLQGRVFLHSYDYSKDKEKKVLELIMTAPLVVAQWINMQYYLSTVDNEVFGSGSKVLHNVVGDFAVMQGGSGDLRIGLPMQSVMTENGLVHEPMRLLAVIRAPLAAIDEVLDRHSNIRKLVKNRWIRLVAISPETSEFYEADDCRKWTKIAPTQGKFLPDSLKIPDIAL